MKTTDTNEVEVDPGTRKKRWGAGIILATLSVLFLLCTGVAQGSQQKSLPQAQTFTTLSNISPTEGYGPVGNLVADSSGNLFGITFDGGAVFELPCSGMPCTYPTTPKLLKAGTFQFPSAGLTIDSRGDLYAISNLGGVYELPCSGMPCTYPSWKLLYFLPGSEMQRPASTMVVDSAGNLYGTVSDGASMTCLYLNELGDLVVGHGCGYVFKLSPPTGSATAYTLHFIHLFTSTEPGGFAPVGGLLLDSSSDTLYGTTMFGGSGHDGTVFKLSTSGNGFQVLHNFSGSPGDGATPLAGLVMDSSGNLYGTTFQGGALTGGGFFGISGLGTVFELSPPAPGSTAYTERVLLSSEYLVGMYSASSLVMDSFGNLYGTTYLGGCCGDGTVFKIEPSSDTVTILHSFEDGSPFYWNNWLYTIPQSISAGLVTGPLGNFYGTTFLGGPGNDGYGNGTVFEVTNPAGEAEALITQVNALLTAQVINQGQDGSLVKELQDAAQMINAGKFHGAIGNLESFITEVDDLENSGVLTSEQAAPLVNIATAVIEQLQASL